MVNIAALSSIPTTLLEKHVDFWAAFILPTCILVVAIIPVIWWHKRLGKLHPYALLDRMRISNSSIVKLPCGGNILPQTGQIILIACRSHFKLSAAEPAHQKIHHNREVPWTSLFVDEVRRGLKGCRVISCFVIFWLCYNQTTNNIISQAGQMLPQGISNDTMQAFNPIACIIIGPLIQNVIFRFLRQRKITFGPIMRMTVAFFFIAAGIAYAVGLQHLIYSRGPCFQYPLECPSAIQGDVVEKQPNYVSIWLQTPLHFLLAIGEILGLVSLNEYTYSEAPTDLKAMVQALQGISAALAAALGMALGPLSKNPWLVILYGSLTGTMAVSAMLFWVAFRTCDAVYASKEAEATEVSDTKSLDVKNESLQRSDSETKRGVEAL